MSESSSRSLGGILLDRREFLRLSLALAVWTPDYIKQLGNIPNGSKSLQVIIAGAGVAGLCAAYELEKRGHRVTILEGEKTHIGGRIRTLHFGNSLYGEAGAMRIPLNHNLTRHYVDEFGLPLRKFVQSNPEALFCVRGRRERIGDVKKLYSLYKLRNPQTPDDFWKHSVGKSVSMLSSEERADLFAVSPRTDAVRRLDNLSLQQLLESQGLTPEEIEFLAVTNGIETLLPVSAAEHLREEAAQVWSLDFHEIQGGMEKLPLAFLDRLKAKPKMGCEIVDFRRPVENKAGVVYLEDNARKYIEGDAVICTLPFSRLNLLSRDLPFSPAKRRAIRMLHYDSASKVLLRARKRFWETEDKIFGGGSYTDLPSGTTFYPSDNAQSRNPALSEGEGVFLASYTWGEASRHLSSLAHSERVRTVVDSLAHIHPQLSTPGLITGNMSWCWDNYKWSAGAFAAFLPGQHSNLHAAAVQPEGRIYFAGEHTSLMHSWIQGALESALRTVKEVLTLES